MLRSLCLAGLVLACAAPAFAEGTVYACKIQRRVEGVDTQIFSPNLRSDPALHFRFAIDTAAGKACRLDGLGCMPQYSTLAVTSADGAVTGQGMRLEDGLPTTLTLNPNGSMVFSTRGQANGRNISSQIISGANDCMATAEKVVIR